MIREIGCCQLGVYFPLVGVCRVSLMERSFKQTNKQTNNTAHTDPCHLIGPRFLDTDPCHLTGWTRVTCRHIINHVYCSEAPMGVLYG